MTRLWAALLLVLMAGSAMAQPEADQRAAEAYKSLFVQVRLADLQADLDHIGHFGSRLAGSDGERLTLEFIEGEFRRLGLQNIRREAFQVTVPDPKAEGSISGSGWKARVLPLWPNLVRTSTCDLSGPLVYGRKGTLSDLSGKAIEGAIVVLEFSSGANWRNAFKLGAKAVIFIEPDEMERTDAEQKFSSTPLDAPRFLLPMSQAGPVLESAFKRETAHLQCRQDWVVRDTYNVFADLPGADKNAEKERIVLAAPTDAMSIVPSLAPGASGASSLAGLLTLARIAVREPGRRPMTFAAISGNCLALQGWREYAERRIVESKSQFLHLTLDLNDGSGNLGAFGRGWYIDYRNESVDPVRAVTQVLRAHADQIAPLLGASTGRFVLLDATNDSDGRIWRNTIYSKFAFPCEPLMMAGISAVTFATVENARDKIDTPFDTVERFDTRRLQRQVQTLACELWHLNRDPSALGELSVHKVPVEVKTPVRQSLLGGFSTIEGQVAQFDPNKSFIADIPVPGAIAVASHPQKTLAGVRADMIQMVDPKASRYKFLGIPPSSAYFHLEEHYLTLRALGPDLPTGRIAIGPTQGLLGIDFETDVQMLTSYRSIPIVVFPCEAVNLFDLTDPQALTPLYRYSVLVPKADSAPRNYSLSLPNYDPKMNSDQEDCAVLFLPKGSKYKLLMGTSIGEWRLILTGATRKTPGGEGLFTVAGTLMDLPLHAAQDLLVLNSSRLASFAKYKILSPGLDELQDQAKASIKDAEEAKSNKDWQTYDKSSRAAWALALRAHPMIQQTINDVVNGVLFYLALLIPFSYFAERLFFARRGLTAQLFASIGIFIASFILLRAIHPAFEIVSNPSMIFVAFIMGALSVLVATFIVGKFEASLKEMRARQTGLGHIDVGRMSVAMAAFNLGIANMRRRKARTILTTLTLVVMTFIVLSFTSIVPGLTIGEAPSSNAAIYPGLLVRGPGLEPLQNTTYRAVLSEFQGRATVVRRAWYYGAEIADNGILTLSSSNRTADVRTVAGFEPEEANVTAIQKALLPGGRWIRPGDFSVVLLPFAIAQQLRITAADVGKAEVEFAGRKLTVIGILDDGQLRAALDLDGEAALPADFSLSKKYQTESRSTSKAFRKFLRLDPGTMFFAPLPYVVSLGGEIRSVAVKFPEAGATRKALESLMPRLRMNVYAAVPGSNGLEVRQFSILQSSKSAGLGLVLVQMIISAVFVLNTMVASVYERKREIGIFSSIGLAPNHIAVLFFAESCVYGVLGAVIGYFLAQGVARFVIQTNLIPGLYLNFSATSAVLAAGIVLAVVLLSTIYPAKVAERLAAPAYESEIESEPEGDRWEILLPFRVGADEAEALIRFFADWLRGHEEYTVGEYVTSDTSWKAGEGGRFELLSTVWLAPFDLGVSQRIRIEAAPSAAPGVVELRLYLDRLAGEPENWVNVNKRFLVAIRRQFLAWRTRPKAKVEVQAAAV